MNYELLICNTIADVEAKRIVKRLSRRMKRLINIGYKTKWYVTHKVSNEGWESICNALMACDLSFMFEQKVCGVKITPVFTTDFSNYVLPEDDWFLLDMLYDWRVRSHKYLNAYYTCYFTLISKMESVRVERIEKETEIERLKEKKSILEKEWLEFNNKGDALNQEVVSIELDENNQEIEDLEIDVYSMILFREDCFKYLDSIGI